MAHLIQTYGLAILFLNILLEAAGLPVPGETALIAAAVAAERGHLNIAAVIAVGAVAAIVGGSVGFVVGRTGGRRLLHRWRWLERLSRRLLPPSERFFARHGAKTVFVARFFPFLRVTAAWMAGVGKMPWWRFFVANGVGSIAWATSIGLAGYFFGRAATDAIGKYGPIGAAAVGALLLLGVGGYLLLKRRIFGAEGESA